MTDAQITDLLTTLHSIDQSVSLLGMLIAFIFFIEMFVRMRRPQ